MPFYRVTLFSHVILITRQRKQTYAYMNFLPYKSPCVELFPWISRRLHSPWGSATGSAAEQYRWGQVTEKKMGQGAGRELCQEARRWSSVGQHGCSSKASRQLGQAELYQGQSRQWGMAQVLLPPLTHLSPRTVKCRTLPSLISELLRLEKTM